MNTPRSSPGSGLQEIELTTSHWGTYAVARDARGSATLRPLREDPDPSPIGLAMLDAYRSGVRVQRPSIRRSWLEHGPGAAPHLRGRDPFVEVPWERALDLVAAEIDRVRRTSGNEAIFGGSYGWSSAGRFHHAQSQIHRFLGCAGGFVAQEGSYSVGAALALLPHVLTPMEALMSQHDSWDALQEHTRLIVCFGGIPWKNGQVSMGGATRHRLGPALAALARKGCRFVNFSPVRASLEVAEGAVEWLPIRPNTDTAVMLAIATTIVREGLQDDAFLERYCVGFERVRDYLTGRVDGTVRDARWAEAISEVPAARIEAVARALVSAPSLVNVAWSLQRAQHGEQPYWAAILVAALAGQIGLPGRGVAFAYGTINLVGSPHSKYPGPTLPQGPNAVPAFIPAARLADMLLRPGESFQYNGTVLRYPDVRLVYWAGGNPFHHHQDLNRLLLAWRKPETIVVHEQVWNAHAKMADVVLPATSTVERSDIGFANREPLWVAMKPVIRPPGAARDDFDIFSDLSGRLGCFDAFTEGRDTEGWLRHMYAQAAGRIAQSGVRLPDFATFWEAGSIRLPDGPDVRFSLAAFRANPSTHRLKTPSGRIELYSERLAGFGYDECGGHPQWKAPAEWLGAPLAARFPLHLLSDQPARKLHSQLDFSAHNLGSKVAGREPVVMNAADAAARGIRDGDVVRIFNDRGACLAGAVLTEDILRGVVKLSTGAWYDPEEPGIPGSLDKHGNPNVLTRDAGASRLSQGCSAQTCLVQVERFEGKPPAVTAFVPPALIAEETAPRG